MGSRGTAIRGQGVLSYVGRVIATYRLCASDSLFSRLEAGSPVDAHPTERLEAIVCQDEDPSMICLEVVDLLLEDEAP